MHIPSLEVGKMAGLWYLVSFEEKTTSYLLLMLTKGYDNCIHNALYHQVYTNEEKPGNDKLHQLFIPKTVSPVSNTAKCTVTMKLDYLPLEIAIRRLNNCESCVGRQTIRYPRLLRYSLSKFSGFFFSAQNTTLIANLYFWHLHICNPQDWWVWNITAPFFIV